MNNSIKIPKKSELTMYAKTCSRGFSHMWEGICAGEEIVKSDIGSLILEKGTTIQEPELNNILIEIAKRFSKYIKNFNMPFDVENSDVQDFQRIIEIIIDCCEKHHWFENDV